MNLTAQVLHGGCAAVFFLSHCPFALSWMCASYSLTVILFLSQTFFLEYTSDSDCSNIVLFVFWLSSNIFSDFKKRLWMIHRRVSTCYMLKVVAAFTFLRTVELIAVLFTPCVFQSNITTRTWSTSPSHLD